MRQRKDDSAWRHLLGTKADRAIAKEFGISCALVSLRRREAGIPTSMGAPKRLQNVDWRTLLLSGKYIAEIARNLDITKGTVKYHARRLGIEVPDGRYSVDYSTFGCGKIARDKVVKNIEIIGTCSDRKAAQVIGVNIHTIAKYRRKLGIAPFHPAKKEKPATGVSNYYRHKFDVLFTYHGYSPDDVLKATDCLTDMESDIFIARHGLHGCGSCTLKKIGSHYHLSRERIRQIEKRATHKVLVNLANVKTKREEYNERKESF